MEGNTYRNETIDINEDFQCGYNFNDEIQYNSSQGEGDAQEAKREEDIDPIAKFYLKLTGRHQRSIDLERKPNIRQKKNQKTNPIENRNTYGRVNDAKRQYLMNTLRANPQVTTVSLSKATLLSRTKVSQIRKEYELTGNIRITDSGNSKSLPRIQLEEKQNKAILDIVSKNPKIGLLQLGQILQQQYRVWLRRSCLHKRLTQDLGYSYSPIFGTANHIPTLNDEETILSRGRFCKTIQAFELPCLFACGIDDVMISGKNNYAWLPKDYKRQATSSLSDLSRSSVQAVHIISTICASKVVKYDFYAGQLTQQILLDHLRKGFIHTTRRSQKKNIIMISNEICQKVFKINTQIKTDLTQVKLESIEGNTHIIYDELALKSFLKNLSIEYVVFPRFSPTLNPCYYFFRVLQKKFKAYKFLKKRIRSQQQIKAGLTEVMNLMPLNDYSQYFEKISNYLRIKDIKISHFMQNA